MGGYKYSRFGDNYKLRDLKKKTNLELYIRYKELKTTYSNFPKEENSIGTYNLAKRYARILEKRGVSIKTIEMLEHIKR